jgi:transposase-like protein
MPVSSTYVIVLSGEEEAVLAARAQSVRGQYCDRLRARIVLAAAAGHNNAAIAVEVGVCPDTVRKWRRRFAAGRAGTAHRQRNVTRGQRVLSSAPAAGSLLSVQFAARAWTLPAASGSVRPRPTASPTR